MSVTKPSNQIFTPLDLANRIARLARVSGRTVFEPSAGTGALADACKRAGASLVVCNELDSALVNDLSVRYATSNDDFLRLEPARKFDRIVMAPPFSADGWVDHVRHGLSFLEPTGVLVSVIPYGECAVGLQGLIKDRDYNLLPLPENSFEPDGSNVLPALLIIYNQARRFADLHSLCERLQTKSMSERVNELANSLPKASICAVGGFPLWEWKDSFLWCNHPVERDLPDLFNEALGFSALLTFTNKSNKTYSELSRICQERKHFWGLHWINISIVFANAGLRAELAFARDGRFYCSWPENTPTGEVFIATAGIKEWMDYTKHWNDKSFDKPTRDAMERSRNLILEVTKWDLT